jgi:hypothetical protein
MSPSLLPAYHVQGPGSKDFVIDIRGRPQAMSINNLCVVFHLVQVTPYPCLFAFGLVAGGYCEAHRLK